MRCGASMAIINGALGSADGCPTAPPQARSGSLSDLKKRNAPGFDMRILISSEAVLMLFIGSL